MRCCPTEFATINLENTCVAPMEGVLRLQTGVLRGRGSRRGTIMIDAEVLRLRKLRSAALRARALAKILDSDCTQDQSVFARSAVTCWTIARIASGHLRAHPYLSYQQGPSPLDDVADRLAASLAALNARRQNRRLSVYVQQLQNVAREVNDARALTWSPDLSDALGRIQIRMHRLPHATA